VTAISGVTGPACRAQMMAGRLLFVEVGMPRIGTGVVNRRQVRGRIPQGGVGLVQVVAGRRGRPAPRCAADLACGGRATIRGRRGLDRLLEFL
jgi:hypothetical protein